MIFLPPLLCCAVLCCVRDQRKTLRIGAALLADGRVRFSFATTRCHNPWSSIQLQQVLPHLDETWTTDILIYCSTPSPFCHFPKLQVQSGGT